MHGRHRQLSSHSKAELLDMAGQMPISQLLSRHRVWWLGHAARKPETTIVNQLLHEISTPQGPGYSWTSSEAGAGPGAMEGGCQPVLALSVLIVTNLRSFSFSFSQVAFSFSS